jgi:hypothetical protein
MPLRQFENESTTLNACWMLNDALTTRADRGICELEPDYVTVATHRIRFSSVEITAKMQTSYDTYLLAAHEAV